MRFKVECGVEHWDLKITEVKRRDEFGVDWTYYSELTTRDACEECVTLPGCKSEREAEHQAVGWLQRRGRVSKVGK